MSNTKELRGRVVDPHAEKGEKGWAGATVRLQYIPSPEEQKEGKEPREAVFKNTKADGSFLFDLADEKTWPPDEYTLWAFHPQSRKGGKKEKVKVEADKSPEPVTIKMTPDRYMSSLAGILLWFVLVCSLGVLVGGYLNLHVLHEAVRLPLDEDLTALVDLAQKQAELEIDLTATSPVSSTIATAETVFTTLQQVEGQTLFSDQKITLVANLFSQAETAIVAGNKRELAMMLTSLGEGLIQPVTWYTWFWQSYPQRLAEIAMWALFATIARVVFETSKDLLRRDFHWRAIFTRLTLCLTVPALALVITFVLSLFNFSLTFSGNTLKVDMSNVALSIVVAALIGLAPWETWRWLDSLAKIFFDKLGELVGAEGRPAETEEAKPPPETEEAKPPPETEEAKPAAPQESDLPPKEAPWG